MEISQCCWVAGLEARSLSGGRRARRRSAVGRKRKYPPDQSPYTQTTAMSPMLPFSTAGSFILAALALASSVGGAVVDDVQCAPGWDWLYNSLGQTPCTVEFLVEEACETDCVCNPIIYSLASACDACETLTWGNWSHWYTANNCTSVQLDMSHVTIPDTTVVPHWAYADVLATWNSTAAQLIGAKPESSSPASATSPPFTGIYAPPTSSVSSGTAAASSSSHGLSRGAQAAIAAGVIGGVAAVVLVFLLCSRRRTRETSTRFRERVQSRYFDMKVGPAGLENVRMREGPFGRTVANMPPEKSSV
ncbi:hypothetical protein FA95DRAFT_1561119 [Auriscalpium vulgare]|uniref:Uncharacterized protein n=1 Tax=Auriscalpium vulgare TaxID=40419 RepID=A0ACB8RMR1_9AGAM|nr:hypothetical protein FA95DRAFT_1561119 [Auriscalpium vulgare]